MVIRSGAILCFTLLGACASSVRQVVIDRNLPLRARSLDSWRERTIDGESATSWLTARTGMILGGVDGAVREESSINGVTLQATLRGQPAPCSIGSCAPLTHDGYVITAAHCISDLPLLVILPDPQRHRREAVGRVVWNGWDANPPVDLAIVHAELSSNALDWSPLSDAIGGGEILASGFGAAAAGSGATDLRCAGGEVTGAPIADTEAAPERALALQLIVPLLPGDSGGPIVDRDCRLVGISTDVEMSDEGASRAEALRPDPRWIADVIAADRRRSTAPQP